MNNYENWSKEQLIARIKELEADEWSDDVNVDAADDDAEILDILTDTNTNKVIKGAKLFVKWQRASMSELRQHLCIGFARAGRICDILEQAGIIGKQLASKPREVLVKTDEELERIFIEKSDILMEG